MNSTQKLMSNMSALDNLSKYVACVAGKADKIAGTLNDIRKMKSTLTVHGMTEGLYRLFENEFAGINVQLDFSSTEDIKIATLVALENLDQSAGTTAETSRAFLVELVKNLGVTVNGLVSTCDSSSVAISDQKTKFSAAATGMTEEEFLALPYCGMSQSEFVEKLEALMIVADRYKTKTEIKSLKDLSEFIEKDLHDSLAVLGVTVGNPMSVSEVACSVSSTIKDRGWTIETIVGAAEKLSTCLEMFKIFNNIEAIVKPELEAAITTTITTTGAESTNTILTQIMDQTKSVLWFLGCLSSVVSTITNSVCALLTVIETPTNIEGQEMAKKSIESMIGEVIAETQPAVQPPAPETATSPKDTQTVVAPFPVEEQQPTGAKPVENKGKEADLKNAVDQVKGKNSQIVNGATDDALAQPQTEEPAPTQPEDEFPEDDLFKEDTTSYFDEDDEDAPPSKETALNVPTSTPPPVPVIPLTPVQTPVTGKGKEDDKKKEGEETDDKDKKSEDKKPEEKDKAEVEGKGKDDKTKEEGKEGKDGKELKGEGTEVAPEIEPIEPTPVIDPAAQPVVVPPVVVPPETQTPEQAPQSSDTENMISGEESEQDPVNQQGESDDLIDQAESDPETDFIDSTEDLEESPEMYEDAEKKDGETTEQDPTTQPSTEKPAADGTDTLAGDGEYKPADEQGNQLKDAIAAQIKDMKTEIIEEIKKGQTAAPAPAVPAAEPAAEPAVVEPEPVTEEPASTEDKPKEEGTEENTDEDKSKKDESETKGEGEPAPDKPADESTSEEPPAEEESEFVFEDDEDAFGEDDEEEEEEKE